jgi:hypothetical protein
MENRREVAGKNQEPFAVGISGVPQVSRARVIDSLEASVNHAVCACGLIPSDTRLPCGDAVSACFKTGHGKQKSPLSAGFFFGLSFRCRGNANSLGWLMGLEPTTTGITILDSTN